MKNIHRIALALALLITITCGVSASAKGSGSARRRVISGVVTRVNISSRTIELREFGTGRTVTARVREGALLATDTGLRSGRPIERLLPGVVIRDVVVEE
jgi:hypothetical protein